MTEKYDFTTDALGDRNPAQVVTEAIDDTLTLVAEHWPNGNLICRSHCTGCGYMGLVGTHNGLTRDTLPRILCACTPPALRRLDRSAATQDFYGAALVRCRKHLINHLNNLYAIPARAA